jgi:hypothetical protein
MPRNGRWRTQVQPQRRLCRLLGSRKGGLGAPGAYFIATLRDALLLLSGATADHPQKPCDTFVGELIQDELPSLFDGFPHPLCSNAPRDIGYGSATMRPTFVKVRGQQVIAFHGFETVPMHPPVLD